MNSLLNAVVVYRKHGIRFGTDLLNPVKRPVSEFTLPASSVYHHIEYDGISIGPMAAHLAFQGQIKAVSVICVSELVGNEGAPKKQSISLAALEKELVAKNRRLRITRNIAGVMGDANTLIAVNYNPLFQFWKYTRAQYSEIFKWRNAFSTVMNQLVSMLESSDRNHYLFASPPPVLPSIPQLNANCETIANNTLSLFNKPQTQLLLELWKWLSQEHHENSKFAKIKVSKLHLVNIVYIEGGQFIILNLGHLNSFRKTEAQELVPGDPQAPMLKPNSPIDPFGLQKRFLMFQMKLSEVVVAEETNSVATTVEGDDPEVTAKKEDDLPGESIELKSIEDINSREGQALTQKEIDAIRAEEDRIIDETLLQLEDISMRRSLDADGDAIITTSEIKNAKTLALDEAIEVACAKLEASGSLSAAQYKMFKKAGDNYKTMPNPFGPGKLVDALRVEPHEMMITKKALPDAITVHDKSMLADTLGEFDEKYIEKVLPKHMAMMGSSIQRAGYCLTEFTSEAKGDVMGEFYDIKISMLPVEGSASTVHMKVPFVSKDGVMRANDINYRLKKLRVDIPIRKVAPDRIALTTYYGKSFVYRGRKKSNDYGHWLRTKIMSKGLDAADKDITGFLPTPGFDPYFPAPKAFTDISLGFRELTVKGFTCLFDHVQAKKLFGEAFYDEQRKLGLIVLGKRGDEWLLMDKFGALSIRNKDGQEVQIGSTEEFMGISAINAPVDFAEVGILGKDVPVGILLAYFMGFNNLLKSLGVTPRRVEAGKRLNLGDREYAIQFLDETLVFDRNDKLASMVIGGFNEYYKTCRKYSVYNFDKEAVYHNVFENNGLSTRYLRELSLLDKMFVDPITQGLLEEMGEPTSYQGLLIRSCELMLHDQHKNQLDLSEQRLRGYERIAGAVYTELIKSIRQHQGTTGKATKKLVMNPYAVWKRIFEDPSKEQINEINPIQELRHKEAITFSGEGGRSKESMNKESRAYTDADMGVISENTSDSSDVGINTYTSAAPNITTTSGMTNRLDVARDGVSAMLSTSALLSPISDKDDPKRINFIGIQKAHLVPCENYHAPLVSTGYESVIGHRNSAMFCHTAKSPGVVSELSAFHIAVEYADKSVDKVAIGRTFGKSAGLTIPHDITTDLKLGQKVSVGDAIAYHTGFFENDWLNPGRVVFKSHLSVRTVLWEADTTFEDASVISTEISKKIETKSTKVKDITVNFDDDISGLVSVGQNVDYDSVLCFILDKVSADSGVFTEKTLQTLKMVDTQTPKAGVSGVIDKIEVYYHGIKDDLSTSLKTIVDKADKLQKEKAVRLGKPVYTGQVDGSLRIQGEPLALNKACIRIYITSVVETGGGDKGVFCNQLKSVFSDVSEDPYHTEDGRVVDAIFGGKSVHNRIVNSPLEIAVAATVLVALAEVVVEDYFV